MTCLSSWELTPTEAYSILQCATRTKSHTPQCARRTMHHKPLRRMGHQPRGTVRRKTHAAYGLCATHTTVRKRIHAPYGPCATYLSWGRSTCGVAGIEVRWCVINDMYKGAPISTPTAPHPLWRPREASRTVGNPPSIGGPTRPLLTQHPRPP